MRTGTEVDSPDEFLTGTSECESSFRIAGVSVGVRGGRDADIAMVAPLALFRSERGRSDIEIKIEWVDDLRLVGRPVFDSGATWRLYERDDAFQFDFSAPFYGEQPYRRLLVNSGFTKATIQLNASCADRSSYPGVALSYPLDELLVMHYLARESAIELHASGIVHKDGIGNLFVGHSGAGKSTTTRLWTERENVEVLSDDRIIVRRDDQPFRAPSAALGISARGSDAAQTPQLPLHDRPALPIGHSAQDDRAEKQIPRSSRNDRGKMRMYGTPWHGEAMYASPNSAPLARIFVLEHGHGNVITPLTPSQAVAELFARSFVPFHRHEYVDSALVFLEELANAVPVYRYAFEPDQRAVEKIRNFHD
jgi:hypothetical protein